jgi:hypothetical protein
MIEDIQSREIGEIITGVQSESCVKNCDVHPYMKQGVIKSLRLAEESIRMHKWSIAIGIMALISIWVKDGPAADIAARIIKALAVASY